MSSLLHRSGFHPPSRSIQVGWFVVVVAAVAVVAAAVNINLNVNINITNNCVYIYIYINFMGPCGPVLARHTFLSCIGESPGQLSATYAGLGPTWDSFWR